MGHMWHVGSNSELTVSHDVGVLFIGSCSLTEAFGFVVYASY